MPTTVTGGLRVNPNEQKENRQDLLRARTTVMSTPEYLRMTPTPKILVHDLLDFYAKALLAKDS